MVMQDKSQLEERITELSKLLVRLSDDTDLKELLKHIHGPGWTTPAENALTRAIADFMIDNTNALINFKENFVKGALAVGKQG